MKNLVPAVLLFCLWANSAHAQITETKLIAGDGVFDDWFGVSVSTSGDYCLIGAHGDDDKGFQAGSAYIFHHDGAGWVEQDKLVAGDGASEDIFGWAVSISGDYAIVGAYGDDDNGSNAGSAYIFHYNGSDWVQQAKLLTSDGSANDYFGHSVAISGEFAIVGALYESNPNGNAAGSAYIFHYDGTNWVEQTKILASDGVELDNFGRSVAISEDYAVVGAPYENEQNPFAGAAYVYHYNGTTWVEESKLLSTDGGIGEYFGWSVSVSGDNIIVGGIYDTNENGPGAGAAYIFHYNGADWVQEVKLLASDGAFHDWFGASVSISGNYALVGSYADDENGDDVGSAYIFQYDGANWLEQTKLTASDGSPSDQFGSSVSLTEDHAIAGTTWDDANGSSSGSAYVYSGFSLSDPGMTCDVVRFFNARCNMNGTAQAIVKLTGDWSDETVTFDLDGEDHVVTLLSNGTNSIGRMQVHGAGAGGHDMTLEDPAGCYPPVHFNCQAATVSDPEWDALWAEYDLLTQTAAKSETRIIGQPDFGLAGNYPNPFNPSTTIRYTLSFDAPVSVRIYNMLGQEVATVVNEFQKAGEQSVVWNGVNDFGQSVASGLYIYKVQVGNTVMSGKMLLAK